MALRASVVDADNFDEFHFAVLKVKECKYIIKFVYRAVLFCMVCTDVS